MIRRLTPKTWATICAAALVVTLGSVYGPEFSRPVSGSTIVGRVQSVDETILLYSQITPATADLSELDFDGVEINAFGLFNRSARIPLWVGNGGDIPFAISLLGADFEVNGAPTTGDVLVLLLGPPRGELLPLPDHSTLINPGEVTGFEAAISFVDTPVALGIESGDAITFTAIFRAEIQEPEPTPIPTATPIPTPTATPTPNPTPGPNLHEVDALSLPFSYEPQEITIKSGDRVRWTAGAGDPHTATSGLPFQSDGLWNTGIFFSGETSGPIQFNVPGTFSYWCQIHPEDMTGTIVVVP